MTTTPLRQRSSGILAGYVLLTPALVLFAAFIAYPLIRTLVTSLYDARLTTSARTFVGLDNFTELLSDPTFWISLRNNVIILVGSVVLQVGGGILLAAVCARGLRRRASVVARTVIFAPMVMSTAAVGLLWQLVFDPSIGVVDASLRALHLPTPALGWLGDPQLAIYSVLFVATWQYTGFMMVILLAGIQAIPADRYEAAALDGASERQMLRHITVPGIRNVIIAATLITMIGSFKAFDLVYVLTLGGPSHASEVLGTYLYKEAFNLNRMGYASAIAVVLLLFTVVLSLAQLRLQARAERADGGRR